MSDDILKHIIGKSPEERKARLKTMSTDAILEEMKIVKTISEARDILQKTLKVLGNSCYGVLGEKHSPLCNYDAALAVTSCGNVIIMFCIAYVNWFYGQKGFKDIVVYNDTDSVYLELDEIVQVYFKKTGKEMTKENVFNFMKWFSEEKISPVIDEAIVIVCKMFKAEAEQEASEGIVMKMEALGPKLFLNGRKHYAMAKWYDEGRYFDLDDPEITMKGLYPKTRACPESVRGDMTKSIEYILADDPYAFRKLNESLIKGHEKYEAWKIASVKPANSLEEKTLPLGGPVKGALPVHKGCISYNAVVRSRSDDRFREIQSGEKVYHLYLLKRNPTGAIDFCWPLEDEFPHDLVEGYDLRDYIDRPKQFEKTYRHKVKEFAKKVDWTYSTRLSMDEIVDEIDKRKGGK